MAFKFSMFNIPKHRTFSYRPRVWDPVKEEQQERWHKSEEDAGVVHEPDPNKPYVPNLRGQFRKNIEASRLEKKAIYSKTLSRMIVLVTVVVLFLAIYYMAQLFPFLFTIK